MIENEIFRNYAAAMIEKRRLEAILEELKPQVIESMDETEFETVDGKFTISETRKWVYPPEIKVLEDAFKKAKKEAEQLGTAAYESEPKLIFTIGK